MRRTSAALMGCQSTAEVPASRRRVTRETRGISRCRGHSRARAVAGCAWHVALPEALAARRRGSFLRPRLRTHSHECPHAVQQPQAAENGRTRRMCTARRTTDVTSVVPPNIVAALSAKEPTSVRSTTEAPRAGGIWRCVVQSCGRPEPLSPARRLLRAQQRESEKARKTRPLEACVASWRASGRGSGFRQSLLRVSRALCTASGGRRAFVRKATGGVPERR